MTPSGSGRVTALVLLALLFGTPAAPQPALGSPLLDRARFEPFIDGVVRHAVRQDAIAGVTVADVGPSGPVIIKG
ncbi:hypothetical protein [Phenylobacterium sp.]|uniref:hypothetical protein n=1 Tax=Phenylobacterium sp. TaxID=1871053 RepID=UPI0035657136